MEHPTTVKLSYAYRYFLTWNKSSHMGIGEFYGSILDCGKIGAMCRISCSENAAPERRTPRQGTFPELGDEAFHSLNEQPMDISTFDGPSLLCQQNPHLPKSRGTLCIAGRGTSPI